MIDDDDVFGNVMPEADDFINEINEDSVIEQVEVILTADQEVAVQQLLEAILKPRRLTKILLEGYAGTGKTFTINRVVERVKKLVPRISFGMTAPTHKAVRQLKKHSELKDKLDFGTIHSFLGLKEVMKDDPKDKTKQITTYEPEWNSNKERRIDFIDVLIVDESSMLSDILYGYIDDVARNKPNLIVIFMGDPLQIPPVRDDDGKDRPKNPNAIPFVPEQRQSRGIDHLVLREIVRQKGDNPIISYATAIREQYKNQIINWKGYGDGDTGVQVLPRDIKVLREVFLQYFDTPMFQDDPDYIKVIAWRNETVNYFNNEIRLLINKADTLPRIIPGEKLVLNKPILKGDKIVLPNNEEMDVITADVIDLPFQYKLNDPGSAFDQVNKDTVVDLGDHRRITPIKVYKCKVITSDNKEYLVDILHEDSEKEYEVIRQKMVKAAQKLARSAQGFESKDQWREFFRIEKLFAWVKYNYCLTAHKAQGSTYDYAVSMEWDIDQNRDLQERNRIRYVAATRARHKLFIVK